MAVNPEVQALARQIADLEEQVRALATARQIARSTVQIGGEPVPVPDALQAGAQAGAVAEEAQQAAADALAEAALAKTTADGKNRIIASPTEPVPGEDATFTQGDLWYELDDEGRTVRIHVWDGQGWEPQTIVANQVIVPGTVGPVLIEDGAITGPKIAAEAIDGKTIRGAYVEAPLVASSPNLGTGANVLEDPQFQGATDEFWVATGHTGETGFVQKDIQTWHDGDNTWYSEGRIEAHLTVLPVPASPGAVLRNYHSRIVDPTTRTINSSGRNTNGGIALFWFGDKGAYTDVPPLATPQAVTTTLSNTAVFQMTQGKSWMLQLEHAGLDATTVQYVTDARAQIVDATTGAVLWERVLSSMELANGTPIRESITGPATTSAKFRVRATYQAAGSGVYRYAAPGSYLRGTGYSGGTGPWNRDIANFPVDPQVVPGYGATPLPGPGSPNAARFWLGDSYEGGVPAPPRGPEVWHKSRTNWRLTSVVLGTVAPEKGYRIDQEQGFQLFNEAGAQTGRLDGEDNFLAGTFATAESGQRVEMDGDALTWYDQYGQVVANLAAELATRLDGSYSPYRVAAGTFVVNYDWSPGAFTDVSISFPAGRFTTAPIVIPSTSQVRLNVAALSGATTGGCTLRIFNPTNVTVTAAVIRWEAIQMTKDTAAG